MSQAEHYLGGFSHDIPSFGVLSRIFSHDIGTTGHYQEFNQGLEFPIAAYLQSPGPCCTTWRQGECLGFHCLTPDAASSKRDWSQRMESHRRPPRFSHRHARCLTRDAHYAS